MLVQREFFLIGHGAPSCGFRQRAEGAQATGSAITRRRARRSHRFLLTMIPSECFRSMNDTATGFLRVEEAPSRRVHPRRGERGAGKWRRVGKIGKLPLAHVLTLGYYYELLLVKHNGLRAWRNWQTRTVQVRMGATPWRFKSSRPHHLKLGASAVAEVFYFPTQPTQKPLPIIVTRSSLIEPSIPLLHVRQ